jgi:hypothetical protein
MEPKVKNIESGTVLPKMFILSLILTAMKFKEPHFEKWKYALHE